MLSVPIHVIVMIHILSMDRPAVGLRLPKLPILFAALWIVIFGRQFQTFVPAMSEERIIPMQFSLLSFVPLFFLLMLVFLLFQPTLIILFLLPLPFIQQNLRCNPRLCRPCFWRFSLLISALLLIAMSFNFPVFVGRYLSLGFDCSSFSWFGWY